MCDPMIMGALSIAGGVMQGVGAAQQMKAQAVSHANEAEMKELQKHEQHMASAYKMARLTDEAKRIGGQQRAATVEGGLTMTGSAMDVAMDTANEIDLDLAAIKFNSNLTETHLEVGRQADLKRSADANSAVGLAFLTPILGAAAKFPI